MPSKYRSPSPRGWSASSGAPRRRRRLIALAGAMLILATTACAAQAAGTLRGAMTQNSSLRSGAASASVVSNWWTNYSETSAARTDRQPLMNTGGQSPLTIAAYGSDTAGWSSWASNGAGMSATRVVDVRGAGLPAPNNNDVWFIAGERGTDHAGTAPWLWATMGGLLLAFTLLAVLYARARGRQRPTRVPRQRPIRVPGAALLTGRVSALAGSAAATVSSAGYARPRPLVVWG